MIKYDSIFVGLILVRKIGIKNRIDIDLFPRKYNNYLITTYLLSYHYNNYPITIISLKTYFNILFLIYF